MVSGDLALAFSRPSLATIDKTRQTKAYPIMVTNNMVLVGTQLEFCVFNLTWNKCKQ